MSLPTISAQIRLTPRADEISPIGFVSHESFIPWLEMGRAALLNQFGITYREFESAGYFLPVLEVKLMFHRPARLGDTIDVITTVPERPPLRFKLRYTILRGTVTVATGHTIQGFVDRSGRPVRPPEKFRALVDAVYGPVVKPRGSDSASAASP